MNIANISLDRNPKHFLLGSLLVYNKGASFITRRAMIEGAKSNEHCYEIIKTDTHHLSIETSIYNSHLVLEKS